MKYLCCKDCKNKYSWSCMLCYMGDKYESNNNQNNYESNKTL